MTTLGKRPGPDDVEFPASITREAVEALAQRQGKSVLDLLTALQGAATRLNDGEVTLDALSTIKSQILEEQGLVPPGPQFPHVNVQLVGQDGNVFNIIGLVCKALRKAGATSQDIKSFTDEINRSGSYDHALQVVTRWVEVS